MMPLLCLIFRVRAIPVFRIIFILKSGLINRITVSWCIQRRGEIERRPLSREIRRNSLSAMMPFRRKMLQLIQEIIILLCLIISSVWPSKLFINYQMEFKLHKMEGLLKRNAQSGIIHSFKLLMKSYTEGGISMQKCFGFRTLLKQCKILLKLIFDRTVASCTVSSCHLARK